MLGKVQRREFLKWTAAGAVLPAAGAIDETASKKYSAYDRVELGKTGIRPSLLSFGTGVRSINRSSGLIRKGHTYMVDLLRAAYERGIRCFDMADAYGSHQPVAEALKPFPRDSYVLITKIWWRGGGIPDADKKSVPELIDRFLRETQSDYLDVVQLHCVDNPSWATELADRMEQLDACKKAGKIRAHGISIHAFSALHAAPDVPWLDVAHVRINPFGSCMEGPVDRNAEELRRLKEKGKGVIAMKIIGEGAFSNEPDKIDQSIAFALHSGVVDVLNIGFLSLAEIDDIAARIAKVPVKS